MITKVIGYTALILLIVLLYLPYKVYANRTTPVAQHCETAMLAYKAGMYFRTKNVSRTDIQKRLDLRFHRPYLLNVARAGWDSVNTYIEERGYIPSLHEIDMQALAQYNLCVHNNELYINWHKEAVNGRMGLY